MPEATALVRNLVVLARTAARQVGDDPALLAVQTLRRLPKALRARLAGALIGMGGSTPTVTRAFGHYLADRPNEARQALLTANPRSSAARHTATELHVALGGRPPDEAPATSRARAAWNEGRLTDATSIAGSSTRRGAQRYAAVLASEATLLTPGFRLEPPHAASHPRRRASGGGQGSKPSGIRPLHLLTNSLPWTQSGYSLRSHSILRAQAAAGFAVEAVTRAGYPVIVGLPHARDVDVIDGITYRRIVPLRLAATPSGRLDQTAAGVVDLARAHGATVLHTTTHYPNALVTEAASRVLDVPWVYEVRGQLEKTWVASRPAAQQEQAARSERYLLARAKEAELAGLADHVVTLSRTLRDDLIARGVAPEKISLVPNAVDQTLVTLCDNHPLSPAAARAELGLPTDGFWVGSVSSIVDYEGLEVLIRAVAQLREGGLDARCAIVGYGVSRPELISLASSLGIAHAVVLPGRVPPSEAVRWHRALDVFAVPRRDTEVTRTVTPLKPIEAMALGRPVVASDLPALAEVVEEPSAGLLAAPGDPASFAEAVARLAADPDLMSRLGANGRAFARTRTWGALAETYRTIYEGVGARGA